MRRNVLYGPRIQGDMDLGLQVTRVGSGVKDWARMDFPGGRLPGQSAQETYEESATQKYRIGTRRVQDDRVFRYMKADANGWTAPFWACLDTHSYKDDDTEDCIEGVTVAAGAIGDYTLAVLDTNASHIANFFAGGWAALTVGSVIQIQRIRASTAGGTSVTLTFWDPLAVTVTLGSQIQVFPSPYTLVGSAHVGGVGDGAKVVVCMPIIPVTASYYFWGQTWGPCYGIPSATFPRAEYITELIFNAVDGSITAADYATGATRVQQRAGYRMMDYSGDPTGALLLFELQIKP